MSELRKVGDVAFRNLRKQVARWQEYGLIDPEADNLRVTQVVWCSAPCASFRLKERSERCSLSESDG